MKLVNVRLGDEDAAKVLELRRRGIEFSALVRDAVRKAYDQSTRRKFTPEDADRFFAELDAKYPDPPNHRPRTYDVHDRRQFQQAIAEHLRRKRVGQ